MSKTGLASLRNQQYNITIDISDVDPVYGYITFYLTDDGQDGLCCNQGTGSIYLCSGLKNWLLFHTTAEGLTRWTKQIEMSKWL